MFRYIYDLGYNVYVLSLEYNILGLDLGLEFSLKFGLNFENIYLELLFNILDLSNRILYLWILSWVYMGLGVNFEI